MVAWLDKCSGQAHRIQLGAVWRWAFPMRANLNTWKVVERIRISSDNGSLRRPRRRRDQ